MKKCIAAVLSVALMLGGCKNNVDLSGKLEKDLRAVCDYFNQCYLLYDEIDNSAVEYLEDATEENKQRFADAVSENAGLLEDIDVSTCLTDKEIEMLPDYGISVQEYKMMFYNMKDMKMYYEWEDFIELAEDIDRAGLEYSIKKGDWDFQHSAVAYCLMQTYCVSHKLNPEQFYSILSGYDFVNALDGFTLITDYDEIEDVLDQLTADYEKTISENELKLNDIINQSVFN